MARRPAWLWAALILPIGAGYLYQAQSAVMGGQIESIRIALAFLPLLALAYWIATRARRKLAWSVVLFAAGVAVYALEHWEHGGLAAAYGIPHAAIYAFLLWHFGRTLRGGNEPLVTRLARRVHGALPPDMAVYTRRVTVAWCIFCAAQLALSALLFGFASPDRWSLYISLLNFPLLALMFTGEYAWRRIRHPEFLHASLLDGVRAFSNDAALPAGTGGTGRRT